MRRDSGNKPGTWRGGSRPAVADNLLRGSHEEGENGLTNSGPNLGPSGFVQVAKPLARTTKPNAPAPLLEDDKILESVRGIVSRFMIDPNSRQDMLQECLLCLWLAEGENPSRTVSWYLQRCRFHVQHWLARGRSLDSPKRASTVNRLTIDGDDEEPALAEHHTDGEVIETVCVRDLIATLAKRLERRELFVLGGLAAGLTLREVASESRLSYPTALKYRDKIAALALKLGLVAPPPQRKTIKRSRRKRTGRYGLATLR